MKVTLTSIDPETGIKTEIPPTSVALVDPQTGVETVIWNKPSVTVVSQSYTPKPPPWYKRAWFWAVYNVQPVLAQFVRWWT